MKGEGESLIGSMIVSVSGFNYTGSGAVFDLLKEYEEINIVNGEIGFIYLPDGLVDLDYNLNDSSSYLNGDVALERFWNLVSKSMMPKEYKGKILCATKDYLNSLTQVTWNGNSTFDGTRKEGSTYLIWKVRRLCSIVLFHYFKKISNICNREMKLSHHPDNFMDETAKYLDEISKIFGMNGRIAVMNQFFSAYTPEKSMKYLRDAKTIVVDRDPRDVYLVSQKTRRTQCFPFDDVKKFVTYFKTCWDAKENETSDRVLTVQFEDLIYKYDETVRMIEQFLGVSKHNSPKTYFKPEVSINNTQLFNRFPDKYEDIKYIEDKLRDYIYQFPFELKSDKSFF